MRVLLAGIVCLVVGVSAGGQEAGRSWGWSELDAYQGWIGRERFERALEEVYAPGGRWREWVEVDDEGATVATGAGRAGYRLRFAVAGVEVGEDAGAGRGLRGLRIVLDPGHIGGAWGPMEERSFAVGGGAVVQEGDLVLATARRLEERLRAAGAEVWLTREDGEPATGARAGDFAGEAAERLPEGAGGMAEGEVLAAREKLAQRLFYLRSEIRARAELINERFRPDVTLALHINAHGWVDPRAPALVAENNGHVIVHGCYLPEELGDEESRFLMLRRLCRGYDAVELPLARALAGAMVEATGLGPYRYDQGNACSMDGEGYVWARNLLANRIYDSPVVYLEPWVLNSGAVYGWAALGDYEGERVVDGVARRSLPAVYAEWVVEGLERWGLPAADP